MKSVDDNKLKHGRLVSIKVSASRATLVGAEQLVVDAGEDSGTSEDNESDSHHNLIALVKHLLFSGSFVDDMDEVH